MNDLWINCISCWRQMFHLVIHDSELSSNINFFYFLNNLNVHVCIYKGNWWNKSVFASQWKTDHTVVYTVVSMLSGTFFRNFKIFTNHCKFGNYTCNCLQCKQDTIPIELMFLLACFHSCYEWSTLWLIFFVM